jgi:hypothetical protein
MVHSLVVYIRFSAALSAVEAVKLYSPLNTQTSDMLGVAPRASRPDDYIFVLFLFQIANVLYHFIVRRFTAGLVRIAAILG